MKEGKVVLDRAGNKYKKINGFIAVSYIGGGWGLNAFIGNNEGFYIEEPEPLKLEVGKFYKTRSGKKAFVYTRRSSPYFYPFYVVIIGKIDTYCCTVDGKYSTNEESAKDLVAPWEE